MPTYKFSATVTLQIVGRFDPDDTENLSSFENSADPEEIHDAILNTLQDFGDLCAFVDEIGAEVTPGSITIDNKITDEVAETDQG